MHRAIAKAGGWEWETASVFSFCSVCFLFRSTAQFWFGPLWADGVWQVRISGATHLCLPQGWGSAPPAPTEVGSPASSTCLLASFFPLSPFLSLSFFFTFVLSFTVSLYFLPLPPLPSPFLSSGSWSLSLSLFCLSVPL